MRTLSTGLAQRRMRQIGGSARGFALLAALEWSNTRAAPTVCLCIGALGVDIRICR
jgi:hypothetical protein